MPAPVFAYKVLPLVLKAASWHFRRSPKMLALLWLLPLLQTPANQRRRAARVQLLKALLARTSLHSKLAPMAKPLSAAAPFLRTWYENGRRKRR